MKNNELTLDIEKFYGRKGNKKIKKLIDLIEKGKLDIELNKLNIENLELWFNLGVHFAKCKNYKIALKINKKIVQLKPDFLEVWFNIGKLYEYMEDFHNAIISYKKIIKDNPSHEGALNDIGVMYEKLGNYEKGLKYYNKILKINTKNEYAWYNKGVSLSQIKKYDKAVDCFNEAIEINKLNIEAYYNKGIVLCYQRKYIDAIKCFDEIIKIDKGNIEALLERANILFNLKKFDKALKIYLEITKLYPLCIKAWHNMAILFLAEGRYKAAVQSFEKVLEIDSDNPVFWHNKAIAHSALGEHEKAEYCFNNSLILSKALKNPFTIFYKGESMLYQGKFKDAIKCFNKIKNEEYREYVHFYFYTGLTYVFMHKFRKAMNEFKKEFIASSKIDSIQSAERAMNFYFVSKYAISLVYEVREIDKEIINFQNFQKLSSMKATIFKAFIRLKSLLNITAEKIATKYMFDCLYIKLSILNILFSAITSYSYEFKRFNEIRSILKYWKLDKLILVINDIEDTIHKLLNCIQKYGEFINIPINIQESLVLEIFNNLKNTFEELSIVILSEVHSEKLGKEIVDKYFADKRAEIISSYNFDVMERIDKTKNIIITKLSEEITKSKNEVKTSIKRTKENIIKELARIKVEELNNIFSELEKYSVELKINKREIDGLYRIISDLKSQVKKNKFCVWHFKKGDIPPNIIDKIESFGINFSILGFIDLAKLLKKMRTYFFKINSKNFAQPTKEKRCKKGEKNPIPLSICMKCEFSKECEVEILEYSKSIT